MAKRPITRPFRGSSTACHQRVINAVTRNKEPIRHIIARFVSLALVVRLLQFMDGLVP